MGAPQWIEGRVRQHAVPGGADDMTLAVHDSDWKLFGRTGQSGRPLLFRSRTHVPEVREYAASGRPRSADDLNAFEDSLVGALEAAKAEVYLIALVTGEGHRDLFFA